VAGTVRTPHPSGISNSRVDKAGGLLREWWTDFSIEMDSRYGDASEVLYDFRAGCTNPLKKVTVGLRQFAVREAVAVVTEGGRQVMPAVGQRLKRTPQILNKLARFPTMRLSQMDDVGGCRAVMTTQAEVDGILRRMRKNKWEIVRIDDYVAEPKATGYRAKHVIVRRDGCLIEVQLRTESQHEWAEAVDRTALRVDDKTASFHGLKDGHGPPELVEYFRLAADAMALEEQGEAVDDEFERRILELQQQVRPYLRRKE